MFLLGVCSVPWVEDELTFDQNLKVFKLGRRYCDYGLMADSESWLMSNVSSTEFGRSQIIVYTVENITGVKDIRVFVFVR